MVLGISESEKPSSDQESNLSDFTVAQSGSDYDTSDVEELQRRQRHAMQAVMGNVRQTICIEENLSQTIHVTVVMFVNCVSEEPSQDAIFQATRKDPAHVK